MKKEDIEEFVSYVKDNLTGDEKGQAQLFCDRLFRAFGHKGIFEAVNDNAKVYQQIIQ